MALAGLAPRGRPRASYRVFINLTQEEGMNRREGERVCVYVLEAEEEASSEFQIPRILTLPSRSESAAEPLPNSVLSSVLCHKNSHLGNSSFSF